MVTVNVLATCTSDHNPIHVSFSKKPIERYSYKRRFKFEVAWLKDEEYPDLTRAAWANDELGVEPIAEV